MILTLIPRLFENYIWENLDGLVSHFGQILYSFHICDIIFDLFNFENWDVKFSLPHDY